MRHALGAITVLLAAAVCQAELTPDEVAVIAMAQSEQSRSLAEYYAQARGIPESQVFLLDGEPGETMSREAWQQQARPAIRAWLAESRLDSKVRCLVSCWDVPLQIAPRSPDAPVVVARQEYFTQVRAKLIEQLATLLESIDTMFLGEQAPERPALEDETDFNVLTAQCGAVLTAARDRLNAAESEEERRQLGAAFERGFVAIGGINELLQQVARGGGPANLPPDVAQKIAQRTGQLEGLREGLQALTNLPDTVVRDMQMLSLLQKAGGLIASIRWIDEERRLLEKNETRASFDSELSLLHWPDYALFRWQPNVLQYRYDNRSILGLKTLMVSRLEAPTFELAKNLIDTAIATEREGLVGKVYLDSRGMTFDPDTNQPDSYAAYDQSLRDLAERLQQHTELEVVLNDEAALFQEGECPDAALYCGWYSLAKYVDAFDWRPGAVGYHLASLEAITLRTPGSGVWCNAMLEDGICATLGPAFDPDQASFPLPDDFFSLLLCGRYTLAEAYYRSKPLSSWAMVLVGDPLYNPFGAHPPLAEDALPQRITGTATEEPQ